MIKRNFRITVVFLFGLCLGGCNALQKYSSADSEGWVTLSSLMDEMGDPQADACFPEPYYEARQLTSYDRRSLLPGTPWWHANDDWAGFERYEANDGRVERVLFDEQGPGAITRIITTGGAGTANLRFYFDGEQHPSIVIPSFDISKFPVEIPSGMIYMHEHYPRFQGASFYYPIPYARRCKITVDDLNRGYVYHVNYRTYAPGTKVRTFTVEEARKLRAKAAEAGRRLENPVSCAENGIQTEGTLPAGGKLGLDLPAGENAVRTLMVDIGGFTPGTYGQLMRGIIVRMDFDDTQTVRVPLSDLSGAGMGAPRVDNYYMAADGQGRVILRFVMPYRSSARVELENITSYDAKATLSANVSPWKWYDNTRSISMLRGGRKTAWKPTKGSTTTWPRCPGGGYSKAMCFRFITGARAGTAKAMNISGSMANRSPRISDAGRRIITIPPMPRSMCTIFRSAGHPVRMTRLRAAITRSSVSAGWMRYRSIRV